MSIYCKWQCGLKLAKSHAQGGWVCQPYSHGGWGLCLPNLVIELIWVHLAGSPEIFNARNGDYKQVWCMNDPPSNTKYTGNSCRKFLKSGALSIWIGLHSHPPPNFENANILPQGIEQAVIHFYGAKLNIQKGPGELDVNYAAVPWKSEWNCRTLVVNDHSPNPSRVDDTAVC